jgi:spoIIIJ-associated protein
MPDRRRLDLMRGFIQEILDCSGLALRVELSAGREELFVNVSGGDRAYLLTDEGETILSLQYVLAKMIRQRFPDQAGRFVVVDSDGYMMRREQALRRLAGRTMSRVRKERRKIRLRPMNPYDRRIIHMEVGRSADLDSISEGEGFFKRIVVCQRR